MTAKRKYEELELIVSNFGYKLLDEYHNSTGKQKVIISDNWGYKYDVFLQCLITGGTPHFVSPGNRYSLENVSLWLSLNKKSFRLSNNNIYRGNKQNLRLYCLVCKEEFLLTWNNMRGNDGCSNCKNLKFSRPDLAKEYSIKNIIPSSKISKGSKKIVLWKCEKCGYEWESCVSNRLKGQGCPGCSGRAVTNNNRLSILYPDLIEEWDFLKNKNITPDSVSFCSAKKVWWICNECGWGWISTLYSRTKQSSGCPLCKNFSKGERKIENFLLKNRIDYIPQKKFAECVSIRKLPFDFYLQKTNSAIEYQGLHHYEVLKNDYFGGLDDLLQRQKRDRIKREFCKNNDIQLLEISYWDFNNIEKILAKHLL